MASPTPRLHLSRQQMQRIASLVFETWKKNHMVTFKEDEKKVFERAVRVIEEGPHLTRVQASIIVEKNNHKKIVVGAGGSMLKKIGSEARAEIEKLLDRKVYLGLFVKVVEGWTEDPQRVRELAMETSS